MTEPKIKCPWCPEEVPRDKYAEHLSDHYKTKDKKTTGPFPLMEKKKDGS